MNQWSRSAASVLALLLAACADDGPVQPRLTPAARTLASTVVERGLPPPVANEIRYRDAGHKPGTGRSGSASLTIRALLARDHTVDLAITTGTPEQLDDLTGPGNVDKVQLKVFDTHGNHIWTRNHNKLKNGGFASYGLANLPRGSRVQVQASVSGIDPTRIDVITVTDSVMLRPDLRVQSLTAPAAAPPNSPVSIGATVREVNGDMGARADCVLSVDGAEVDRAPGVWVEAGGSVSCAFSHAFSATGTRALKVRVENVVPGDWDSANNEVTGSVQVTSDNDFNLYGHVSDETFSYFYKMNYWSHWSYDGVNVNRVEGGADLGWSGREVVARSYGWTERELAFPLRIALRHTSGRQVLTEWTLTDAVVESPYAGAPFGGCVHRVVWNATLPYLWVDVCSVAWSVGGVRQGRTEVNQQRWAGDVVYFGYEYAREWYGDVECPRGCYAVNYDGLTETAGPLVALGPDYTMEMVVSGGGASVTATVTVPLQAFSYTYRQPEVGFDCVSWEQDGWWYPLDRGGSCVAEGRAGSGVRGAVSVEPGS